MAFTVIYDACVLYPAPLRDLLIRLAQSGITRARWTEEIEQEVRRNVLKNRPEVDPARFDRTLSLMRGAVRDSIVGDYQDLVSGLSLPDPDDRHVLAAAIKCHAQVIVTANVSDFPARELSKYGVEARHPDLFVVDQIHLAPAKVAQILSEQAAGLGAPSMTVDDVLDSLARNDLLRSVALLRSRTE